MNLLVEVNPYIEKSYQIPKFSSTDTVEILEDKESINTNLLVVIDIFDYLDIDVNLMTYLGGESGKKYNELLSKKVVNSNIFSIKDNTVQKIKIWDNSRILNIESPYSRITNEEINGIIDLYSNEIENSNVTFLLNSETFYTDELISNFLKISNRSYNKTAISLFSHNKEFLKYKPSIIFIDHNFIESFAKKEITFLWERNNVIKEILEYGIEKIIYYDNKKSLNLYDSNNHLVLDTTNYKLEVSNYNKILAGFISSKLKNYDDEMSLKIGYAAGKINEDIDMDGSAYIKKSIQNINIESYKLK